MQEFLSKFSTYLRNEKQMSTNTVLSYERDIKCLLKFVESSGTIKICKITQTHLTGYILELENNKRAPSTVSRSIASIKSFFYYLMREKIIEVNPSEKLNPPKVIKAMPEILTELDVETLLEAPDLNNAKGKRDKAMLEMLYATGLRVSEIVEIKLEEINLTLQYVKCRFKERIRIIPLGNKAIKFLDLYIKEARSILVVEPDCGCLFVSCQGKQLTRQGFWKIIKKYAAQCNMSKQITPNALRHSFAAHMVANGADLGAVQEMMGHSDISTTQIYVQLNKNRLNEVYRNSHPRAK